MTAATAMTETKTTAHVLSPAELLEHWQGHRKLTRRTIDAFPDDQLSTFTIGGMRPFGVMAMEILDVAEPMVHGILTNEWPTAFEHRTPASKAELLARWDAATTEIDRRWAEIPAEKFQETMVAFGQYPGKVYDLLFYAIDNEIHHRAQGYVYLRALGIAPPPFWERD